MRIFVKNRTDFPLYDWVSESNSAFILNGKSVSRLNYTDEDAEEYIRLYPEQKEFKRNNRIRVEQPQPVEEPVVETIKPKKPRKTKKAE